MRIEEVEAVLRTKKLDQIVIRDQANLRAVTGINCDNGILTVQKGKPVFYTDFRYIPMVHRVAPKLTCKDIKNFKPKGAKIGVEFSMSHAAFLALKEKGPKGAKYVDVTKEIHDIRMVKTPEELDKLRAAEQLTVEIWEDACKQFKAGMTEREMANVIKKMMIDRGEGEAFETIVCVGKNAAECHHEPDDTKWNGRDPVLVDMGVRLNGMCSDMTRNYIPVKPSKTYQKVYDLVLKANLAAIAAAKPGMTGKKLDKVARDVITKGGFGKCFGHSLGHGVGYEIHEAPAASKKSDTVLKPGMSVTIEPGIYLEDNLGVRIEDLVLITETGCEVLSKTAK